MSRCPFAIWLPGPEWKTSGALEATGVTLHSAEYDLDPDDKILFNALHSNREASWHFTITKDPFAFIFQHYENVRTWHCGPGNPYTIGIELEGVAPAIVEGPQYDLLVRLLKWIAEAQNWAVLWRRGRLDTKNVVGGIFEHRQWMPTNCAVFSNNQIDPVRLIADLKEDDMDIKGVRLEIKRMLGYPGDAPDEVVIEDMKKMRVQTLSAARVAGLALDGEAASWKEARRIMDFFGWGE